MSKGRYSKDVIYAIDYGTSNSLLAAVTPDGRHEVLPLDESAPDPTVLRSIVYTPRDGHWFFGSRAIDEYMQQCAEGRLFRSVKKFLPDRNFTGTLVHGRKYSMPDLVALFLREMRLRANRLTEQDVTSVVIGRPVMFSMSPAEDDLATGRLEAAARSAGFDHVSFCPEPLAAAHGFRHLLDEPKTVLVADLGGGTSDFTIVRLGKNAVTRDDVLAMNGTPSAGDAFDSRIMRYMVCSHFGSEVVYRLPTGSNDLRLPTRLINRMCTPSDLPLLARNDIYRLLKDAQRWSISPEDQMKMERLFILVEERLGYKLFREIENSKIELSSSLATTFRFRHPGIDIEEPLQSSDFAFFAHDLTDRIMTTLDDTVRSAGLRHSSIDLVCCTGGTVKIPMLRHAMERRFGRAKLHEFRQFHSVIGGLAEWAASQTR